jgi:hypothetical protein
MIGERRPITLEVHAQAGSATSEQAVSMGLIVTELVLNALKHAFPDGREGKVLVAYDVAGSSWRLTVSDNGIGRPDDDAPKTVPGLGTNLIEALAKQLDARVEGAWTPRARSSRSPMPPFRHGCRRRKRCLDIKCDSLDFISSRPLPGVSKGRFMSIGLILVIILVIFLLGGFSGRFGGYGYGYGHGGIGVIGILVVILLILVLTGRL